MRLFTVGTNKTVLYNVSVHIKPGVSISTNSRQNVLATLLIEVGSFCRKKKQQV